MTKPHHVFISCATEDEAYANELARSLQWLGLSVWFAPVTLQVGGKLPDSINAGLIASQYGLLLLSPKYVSKRWTSYELDVLHRRHIEEKSKLLPIWHGIDKAQLDSWNPGLSGIFALRNLEGARAIAKKIADVFLKWLDERLVQLGRHAANATNSALWCRRNFPPPSNLPKKSSRTSASSFDSRILIELPIGCRPFSRRRSRAAPLLRQRYHLR